MLQPWSETMAGFLLEPSVAKLQPWIGCTGTSIWGCYDHDWILLEPLQEETNSTATMAGMAAKWSAWYWSVGGEQAASSVDGRSCACRGNGWERARCARRFLL